MTSKPVHVTNIRSGRPKPGLMAQHLNAVKAVAALSNASLSGLELGSTEIFFNPESLSGGDYKIDIGTPGSITLILQAFMIPAAFADGPVTINITGGTDLRWSPSVDYLENITLPILKLMGYKARINILKRGHYPRGGGMLKLEVDPIKNLEPLNVSDLKFDCIKGVSQAIKLPVHIAERQAKSAEKILLKEGYNSKIKIKTSEKAIGPGSTVGEPCKRAEKVGSEAAKEILYHISRRSAVDRYMGDQIIPYIALAGKSNVKTAELTQHALTNIHVTEKFIKRKFRVEGMLGESSLISVD